MTPLDPARGLISASEERELSTGKVGTRPPSLEELSKFAEGTVSAEPHLNEGDQGRRRRVPCPPRRSGEDGTIQALLDMANVRYTGSGHLSSALAMDEDLSKKLVPYGGSEDRGLADVPSDDGAGRRNSGLPVVVKPSKQGSTVGLSVVKKREDLAGAIEEASKYDDEVMIERFVPGRELTVGVLGDVALPVGGDHLQARDL